MAENEGTVYEQMLTVGTLRKVLEGWDAHETICICHVGEFGSETFWPVVGVGQMNEPRRHDNVVCLYSIEGRDD